MRITSIRPAALPRRAAPASADDGSAALIARGLLPPDFARYDAATRENLLHGARLIAAAPYREAAMRALRPGDVVLVAGYDPVVTNLDGGTRWVHAALVTGVDPVMITEVWGPNGSGACQVREVPFAQFVAGTPGEGYQVLHPAADPAAVQRAIAYARAQVGEPYDFTFGLIAPANEDAWYCSQLVATAYAKAGAPLPVSKDAQRDKTLAAIMQGLKAVRLKDAPAVQAFIGQVAQSSLLPGGTARYTTAQLVDDLLDHVLPTSPVLKPLAGNPAARQLLKAYLPGALERLAAGKLAPQALLDELRDRVGKLPLAAKLSLAWACLRGLVRVDFLAAWRAWQAARKGAVVDAMVSPADLVQAGQQSFGRTAA
ncbi:MAG: Permuted papain-like amidase enzyme YaeF/YiiX, family [Cyanobacteria bacterium RYN_339]|nr:Permuted papain-like amidase enzyme YaeF/YiiX, family [Cyanobacteria bacterium RYN_339]